MLYFKFDCDKAIAVTLFVSKRLTDEFGEKGADLHKLFKILYFADQKHLVRYGRPIVGDHYIAMSHGPVPSNIYDMMKSVRGGGYFEAPTALNGFFEVFEHFVFPKQEPDLDELSESDLECLEESLAENKHLDFNELKQKSHDRAHQRAAKDDRISYLEIAVAGGADESSLHLMKLYSENENTLP
jgi:uncharacterized phage-associated protein